MSLPDFVIVGAMKAATTSFATDLTYHPDIFMVPREVHFFNSEGNFNKGLDHYRSFFAQAPAGKLLGEKTPTYSYHHLAAERMAEALPQAKIIWLLREPVSRSYSHYNFFVGRGREWRSFSQAVKRELKGSRIPFTQRYLDRSIYSKQINRFLNYYPKSQMLFLLYEDYRRDKKEVLTRTCQFLDVSDPGQWPYNPPSNPTYLPHNYFLQWAAYRIFRRKGFRIYKHITKINRRRVPGYQPLDPGIRQQLQDYFNPHNQELSELTGLNLNAWQDG